MNREQLWRWGFYCIGMIILALGIAMTIKGDRLGIAPWDVLHVGLYMNYGLTIGTWNIIVSASLLVIIYFLSKKMPSLPTWLNIFVIGIFIDIYLYILPSVSSITGNIVMFVSGILIMGIGIGLYVAPEIGAGPRDSLMLYIGKRTGWGLRKVRTLLEAAAAIVGWVLGGPVGIGTIIMAILLGQVVHYSISRFRFLLEKCQNIGDSQLKAE
ncbi:YitT family protein [Chungangia koreensis]|uniref:YitT family protein n=1 Tax=Chungangia koreensis TaxID=752657 RepID=A0ABV8X4P0_9LACT